MAEAAINSAMALVREVQVALSHLRKDLGKEVDEKALRKSIETIAAAETMTRGLIDCLQVHGSPKGK